MKHRSVRLLLLLPPLLSVVPLAGCPTPPAVISLARLDPSLLANDPKVLEAQAEELDRRGDPASLEDCLLVREKQLSLEPRSFDVVWRAARVAFELAEDAVGDNAKPRRAKFSQKGIDYARRAIALDGKRVEGYYYHAVCLGLLASTRRFGALELIPEVMKNGKSAVELGEKFDHGGPHRLLGATYTKAPSWPASVGDVEEGCEHLQRAVAIDPAFPGNHLYYCEALLRNDRHAEAQKECDQVLVAPPDPAWNRMLPRWRAEAEQLLRRMSGG
ncbi:MAG: hypothetical protein EXR72_19840 [Myxococcales bacterium]|nr:hypothetical protein [Myxococcales bacterium]